MPVSLVRQRVNRVLLLIIYLFSISIPLFLVQREEDVMKDDNAFHPWMSHQVFNERYSDYYFVSVIYHNR